VGIERGVGSDIVSFWGRRRRACLKILVCRVEVLVRATCWVQGFKRI
jgi:hypothetical protein